MTQKGMMVPKVRIINKSICQSCRCSQPPTNACAAIIPSMGVPSMHGKRPMSERKTQHSTQHRSACDNKSKTNYIWCGWLVPELLVSWMGCTFYEMQQFYETKTRATIQPWMPSGRRVRSVLCYVVIPSPIPGSHRHRSGVVETIVHGANGVKLSDCQAKCSCTLRWWWTDWLSSVRVCVCVWEQFKAPECQQTAGVITNHVSEGSHKWGWLYLAGSVPASCSWLCQRPIVLRASQRSSANCPTISNLFCVDVLMLQCLLRANSKPASLPTLSGRCMFEQVYIPSLAQTVFWDMLVCRRHLNCDCHTAWLQCNVVFKWTHFTFRVTNTHTEQGGNKRDGKLIISTGKQDFKRN